MALKERLGFTQEPLWLMDGSAFIFRGFYAFQNMQRSDGFPTNALFIVTRILLRLLREEKPRHFAFVLDGKGPTFRHDLFPLYKAQRAATPEPLVQQLEPIRRMVTALGLPLEVSDGCEADDCIASLAARYRDERPVVIIGADKDLKQCLHPNVVLWDPGAKEEKLTTLASFTAETGLTPAQWPDVQAVIGDTSDNIPGIPGVGPKTASKIFADFPTLEDIRDGFDRLPPNLQKKFEQHLDAMFLYRQLTTLAIDRCADLTPERLSVQPLDARTASTFLQEFELRALSRELAGMVRNGHVQVALPGDASAPMDTGAMAAPAAPSTPRPSDSGTPGSLFGEGGVPLPWDTDDAPRNDAEHTPAGATGAGGTLRGMPGTHTSQDDATAPAEAASRETGSPPAQSAIKAAPEAATDDASAKSAKGAKPVSEAQARKRALIQQASLFDQSTRRNDTVATCTDPRGLPPCQGRDIAVVPLCGDAARTCPPVSGTQNGSTSPVAFAVAVAGCEVQYSGPVQGLARHLASAKRIATPDVKALLRSHAIWRDIPGDRWFDLGLAAYLLDPEERDYGWPRLAARWGDMLDRSTDNPGLLALEMAQGMAGRLAGASLDTLMRTLELPLVPVLADMEEAGIAVDRTAFAAFLDEVQHELDRITQEVYKAAGGQFNIRSAQQLGELLFGTLGLPTVGKTRGGQATTSQDALEKLSGRHPVVDLILDFRKLEKLRSTYLEPLPKLVDAAGRIHSTFNQLATATGRLSSSNPNLQNIPARGDLGRRMRSCFTAAEGNLLVSADYSQIELRVLAHMSQDPTLLAAFREGADIHRRTAGLLYDTAPEDVTPDQRRNAKTINFGLIYGMGPQKLGQELRITVNEAKQFIERYFSRLQHLRNFYDNVEAAAREQGHVTTLAGRRRLLPEMHSENTQLRSQARRQAINTLIQGSAADIIKLAMLAAHDDPVLHGLKARLILQVHDELMLEVPEVNAQAAGERLALLMSEVRPGGVTLDVPLLVDWGAGKDWGSAH